MSPLDWVTGDRSALAFPSHTAALRADASQFLTKAFHSSGALAPDNRVVDVTDFKELSTGGTGRKLMLRVAYARADLKLHRDLFVKFSRDFADEIRDRSRHMMDSEVRVAALSQQPGFPVRVPQCYFADFHADSGTGILITDA